MIVNIPVCTHIYIYSTITIMLISTIIILVGGWATPLNNMTSSFGMIRNPIDGTIKN